MGPCLSECACITLIEQICHNAEPSTHEALHLGLCLTHGKTLYAANTLTGTYD